MPACDNISVLTQLRQAAREKTAANPGLTQALLAGGVGALAGGIPVALAMKAHENTVRDRARNVGFGAGVATGLAGPHIARGLYGLTQEGQS